MREPLSLTPQFVAAKKVISGGLVLSVGVLAAVFLPTLIRGCLRPGPLVTVRSLSPNGLYCASLVEHPRNLGHIDRNFEIRLDYLHGSDVARTELIFESPDEGLPVGSERIIWAKNSSRFLLVSRNFYVHEYAPTHDGEQLYLLYDMDSGAIRCNAKQQDRYPAFTRKEAAKTEWVGLGL